MVEKDKALELGAMIAQMISDWSEVNSGDKPVGNEVVSALVTLAGSLIAKQPCMAARVDLFGSALQVLLQGAAVPVMVSTCVLGDQPGDAALAAMPVAGRA